jgi:hypothetical protein
MPSRPLGPAYARSSRDRGQQRRGYAVFLNNITHDIVRLRTGEGEDGWILRSASTREVLLEKNDRTAVICLPSLMRGVK